MACNPVKVLKIFHHKITEQPNPYITRSERVMKPRVIQSIQITNYLVNFCVYVNCACYVRSYRILIIMMLIYTMVCMLQNELIFLKGKMLHDLIKVTLHTFQQEIKRNNFQGISKINRITVYA